MKLGRILAILTGFGWMLVLAACGSQPGTPTPTEAARATASPTQQPSATPTPVVQKMLTICLGEEPNSLYPYAALNAAARSVLAAIYDGPIDTNSFEYQAVILQKLPSLEDGDALVETVLVKPGDAIVDADGLPVKLATGVRLNPSGCTSRKCQLTYDGTSEVQMDQMVVNFSLLPGLTWSDGEPLLADDSIYSYELASNPGTPGSKYLIERTQSYEAVDDLTVQWWGKPGFLDQGFRSNFWAPAPRHAWGDYTPLELPGSDVAGRKPLGWGPYLVEEWLSGDQIHLKKNPNYFRAKEGLPVFDDLFFRFVADPNLAISKLIAGTCDVLDPSVALDDQVELLQAFTANQQLSAKFANSMNLEQLDLGIQPASYDDGISLGRGDRPDLLGDERTRQALAMCLDRERVVTEVLNGLSEVPASFIPSSHPLYNEQVAKYPFDILAGKRLLDEVGWKDRDNDPQTPLEAWEIPGVPDGTKLVLNYVTTGAIQRRQVSEILSKSLAECGVQVKLQFLDPEVLYHTGPEYPLFGRQFDLAEFAMASSGFEPACNWYMGSEIPGTTNSWMGVNFSGYKNLAFDTACQSARSSIGQEVPLKTLYEDPQEIFAQDLPVITLYWQVKVGAARVGLCGFKLDPTSANNQWNIESYRFQTICPEE